MNQFDPAVQNGARPSDPVVPAKQKVDPVPGARITPSTPERSRAADLNGGPRLAQTRPEGSTALPKHPDKPGEGPNPFSAMHAALTAGKDGLARKSDLGEMHRQTIKLFETLNKGLGDQQLRKAAEDRSALIARMERLEKAVNAMEGAVRIEMVPLLRSTLDEALEGHVARQGKRSFRTLWLSLGVAVGLGVGVYFAGDIVTWANSLLTSAEQILQKLTRS